MDELSVTSSVCVVAVAVALLMSLSPRSALGSPRGRPEGRPTLPVRTLPYPLTLPGSGPGPCPRSRPRPRPLPLLEPLARPLEYPLPRNAEALEALICSRIGFEQPGDGYVASGFSKGYFMTLGNPLRSLVRKGVGEKPADCSRRRSTKSDKPSSVLTGISWHSLGN